MAFETVLNIQKRQTAGYETTPARQFVINPNTTTEFNFRMPMAAADILAPGFHVEYRFEISRDNVNWQPWIGTVQNPQMWDSGPDALDRQGNPAPPNCSGAIGVPGTWFIRVAYNVPVRVGIGLEYELIERPTA